jgi:cytochrome P450
MQPRIHPKASLTPFEEYREMRDKEPVAYDEVRQMWHVFRYNEAEKVLSDHKRFSSDRSFLVQQRENVSLQKYTSLIGIDPPKHRELRLIMAQAFTPATIQQSEPHIRHIAADLTRQGLEKQELEVVKDIAYPLPVLTLGHLLGLPREDSQQLKAWADRLVAGNFETIGQFARERHRITLEMADYFKKLLAQRRIHPHNDLLSMLLCAREQGKKLEEDDLIAFCILLLIAGHETTTCLIGNIMLCLHQNPGIWTQLQHNKALIPAAIEEIMRYYAPLKAITRVTMEEVTLGTQTIAARQPICAWVGSANRDERQFADPDNIVLDREGVRHLSFGYGIHSCLGAALARLETKVVLELLLASISTFYCAPETNLEPLDSLMLYGVKQLPIVIEPLSTHIDRAS